MILWLVLLVLVGPFSLVIFFGAPYLPSRKKTINQALDMLNLKPGELLLDLGAGDGAVMVLAAQRGLKVVGYELNPFLFFVAKFRTLRFGKNVQIHLVNFWNINWPKETKGVYVFLHTRFMVKLDKKIIQQNIHIKVVSYTFTIPNREAIKSSTALKLYQY